VPGPQALLELAGPLVSQKRPALQEPPVASALPQCPALTMPLAPKELLALPAAQAMPVLPDAAQP